MAAPGVTPSAATFGVAVRHLRILQGLTVAQLGERSGLSAAIIDALELGDHEPDLVELRALGRGLGMAVSAIVRAWENVPVC